MATKKKVYYFAYGSNMNPARMHARVTAAKVVGTAVLPGWRIVERKYADIARASGGVVEGVVWDVGEDGLRILDIYEGFPFTYDCRVVKVRMADGVWVSAFVYIMTDATSAARNGIPYPAQYRMVCSEGARMFGIRNAFTA